MSRSSESGKEIVLGQKFGNVAVTANGARVEIHTDGRVDAYTDGAVHAHPAANDDAAPAAKVKAAPRIGDEMEDGTIYAGISPDTDQPMYARPKDEPGTFTFNEAAKHTKNIGDGFRVPSRNELDVLYQNRDKGKLKGTFNETGSTPAGWYWSSAPYYRSIAWAQSFSDGYQGLISPASSLRLVR